MLNNPEMERDSGLSRWPLNVITNVPIEKDRDLTHIEEEETMGIEKQRLEDGATSQRMPATTRI